MLAVLALMCWAKARAASPFGSKEARLPSRPKGDWLTSSQNSRSLATRASRGLPTMMAELIAPIEMPAHKSGGRLIAKPEIASAPGDCRGKVRPQQFARQVNADTKCGAVAPGAGVRVVWRDAGAGCKMQRLAKTSVGTCHKFPIVNVGHATDWWRPAAGVQIVTPTEIQIDISDLRTDTGAHRDLSRRIARELNACHAGAGVEMMERSFESSSDRWLMSG